MTKPWSDKIRNIDPYVPGEQPKLNNILKLNANENPYPPSPKVLEAIKEINENDLRRYPSSNTENLKKAAAEFYNVSEDMLFFGNGSDDVIALAFLAFFNSSKPILFPDITYSFYKVWCALFNIPYENPKLTDDFKINADDYAKENGGVILPNPNAPTSIGEGKEFIENILEHNKDSIVIIDEAYVDFGGYPSIELIEKYDNLVIIQTFSKSRSLAGARIGVAISNPYLISILDAVKNSYNSYTVDSLAIKIGCASLEDKDYFIQTNKKICQTRDNTAKALKDLGFTVLPSKTNFLFVTHTDKKAVDIFSYLKENNIFVRHFNLPRIDNYLRITIGTDEQMSALIECIKNMK